MQSAEESLRNLGIELPDPVAPKGVYRNVLVSGNMLTTSGHLPADTQGNFILGKLERKPFVREGRGERFGREADNQSRASTALSTSDPSGAAPAPSAHPELEHMWSLTHQ